MVAHTATIALSGIAATSVDVQVQIAPGLSSFQVVGLPDGAVRESKERIRAAFHALGISLPAKRIVVNLAPADISKEGSHYDLPIAVGLLIALGTLPQDAADQTLFMGELGLDGSLHPVPGCLPAAIHAAQKGHTKLFVPKQNGAEASWAQGLDIFAASSLKDVMDHIKGEAVLSPEKPAAVENAQQSHMDLSDIRGQEQAKRAAEIAAAGGHNLLLIGPPGSGKSMLAARMPDLLPPLNPEEALEVSMIHSVAGQLNGDTGLVMHRPYRDPHHSASAVALCGGGIKAKPGEISLSHRGVLFMDELPEFSRQVLETLRQPLETGNVTVSRANHHVTYPARFQLIAAMNPCPCGYLGMDQGCSRQPGCAAKYQNRLSGPLLDRIDLHVHVPPVDVKDLNLPPAKEGTKEVAARVATARALQNERYKDNAHIVCNSDLSGKELDAHCRTDDGSRNLLNNAAEKFNLSARAYHRILKVARTIADLENAPAIQKPHVAEALAYRQNL